MAFAGGPFNNFVLQSLAAAIPSVRAEPGSLGMVTTVSGLLTKPGIGIWSAVPDGHPPLVADLASDVAAETSTVDVVETLDGYRGPGTVATYTVTYEGQEPVRTVVLCDLPDGRRSVAISESTDTATAAVASELIGGAVHLEGGDFTLV
jgi:acetyl-CoA C-acetyltransferase